MKQISELWKKLEHIELVQVRPSEMEALYLRCFEFEHPNIVEIGSAHGASSTIFAEAIKELGGQLICIDSYPEDYEGQEKFGEYAHQEFLKNMKQYELMMSLVTLPSSDALEIVKKSMTHIDVLFIDGDHSYEGVRVDCENYIPLVSTGGYVGFHDYNNVAYSGVKKAADTAWSRWNKVYSVWDLAIFQKI